MFARRNHEHVNRAQPKFETSGHNGGKPPHRNPVWETIALQRVGVQPKSISSCPTNPQEKEADRVADCVTRGESRQADGFLAAGLTNGDQHTSAFNDGRSSEALHKLPARVRETLSTPGQPLDSLTRSFMEPGFGRSFDSVRVHVDESAAASASAMHASAYTVGNHVVMGPDRFKPHTLEGRRLIAHELTHVVQQSQQGPAIQRKDDDAAAAGSQGDTPDPATDLAGALLNAVEEPLFKIILTPPKSAKRSGASPAVLILKQQWPAIHRWILSGGTKDKKAPKAPPDGFGGLAAQPIVDALNAHSAQERTKVADEVFDRLVQTLGKVTPDLYKREFGMLDKLVQGMIEPDSDRLAGYVSMREGLKATFGSIQAINKFYKTLVPADFPPGSNVRGTQSLVHPELKKALDKAAKLLSDKKLTEAVIKHLSGEEKIAGQKHVRGYWATVIRENRNRPSEIGNHSFGFAIDFNSDWNPNLPDFPWEHVQRLTGFDVYGKEISQATPKEKFDTVLKAAKSFKAASDKFRAIFDTESNLKKAMIGEAGQAGAPNISATNLFKAVERASAEPPPRSKSPGFVALISMLTDEIHREESKATAGASPALSDFEVQISAHEPPRTVATIIAGLRSKAKSRADLKNLMSHVIAQINDPKDKPSPDEKKLGLDFLFDKKLVAELRKLSEYIRKFEMPDSIRLVLEPLAESADVTALANYLIQLHHIFISTRIKSGSLAGQKIGIGSTGSLLTVAAHGFMDLMPELVAALTSSEGGGLVWLGTVGMIRGGAHGTKDWMHFQLANPPKIQPDPPWETDAPGPQPTPLDPTVGQANPTRVDTEA